LQQLLHEDGAVVVVLRGFLLGSPFLTEWAIPCAMLARAEVKLLASQPAPAKVDAEVTQELSALLLQCAGQARHRLTPRLIPVSSLCKHWESSHPDLGPGRPVVCSCSRSMKSSHSFWVVSRCAIVCCAHVRSALDASAA